MSFATFADEHYYSARTPFIFEMVVVDCPYHFDKTSVAPALERIPSYLWHSSEHSDASRLSVLYSV